MQEKSKVSCEIPQKWRGKIERLAAERNIHQSQIIYEALAQYLGENANTNESLLNALEAEITILKRQVAGVTMLVTGLQKRSFGTNPPLEKLAQVQPRADEDDDYIEDEPDEILYDFLPPEER